MKFIDEVVTNINKKEPNSKYQSGGIFVSKSSGMATGITLISEILQKQNPKSVLGRH